MYEAAFHLKRRPFGATPDASCFFAPEPIQEILAELIHRVERGQGICILTGAAGMGKTLLCRRLVAEMQELSRVATSAAAETDPAVVLNAETFLVAFLSTASFNTRRSLLQAILYEIGQRYTGMGEQELRLELRSFLKHLRAAKKSLLLVVDEAHLLNERLLEELRVLANLSEAGQAPLRLVLSGQPVLEETLAASAQTAFSQLIACQLLLEPLTIQQSRDYVAHRVEWAEGNLSATFTPEAVDAIARASNGVPRCLNQLCDHSLLLAFIGEAATVEPTHVAEALDDLKQLPLHWNEPLAARSHELSGAESSDDLSGIDDDELNWSRRSPRGAAVSPRQPAEGGSGAYSIEIGGSEPPEFSEPTADVRPPLEDDFVPTSSNDLETPVSPNFTDDSFSAFTSEPVWRSAGVVPLSAGSRRSIHVIEEEVVIDRYAQIDSGNLRFDAGTPRTPRVQPADSAPKLHRNEEPTVSLPVERRVPQEILPLVSDAVDNDGEELRLSDEDSTPPAQTNRRFDAGNYRAETEPLEEQMAAELFDICREVKSRFGGAPQQAEQAQGGFDPQESLQFDTAELEAGEYDTVEYDVIETEAPGAEFVCGDCGEANDDLCCDELEGVDQLSDECVDELDHAAFEFDTVEPPVVAPIGVRTPVPEERIQKIDAGEPIAKPNYKLIFSTLRKKLGRGK